MRRCALFAGLLLILTACPTVEQIAITVHVKQRTADIVYRGLRSDDGEDPDADLATILDQLADRSTDDGITAVDHAVVEADGRLDARVKATWTSLDKLGFYQHDRKSAIIWCVDRAAGQHVTASNGTILDTLPGCVAWDRKAKVLEVTVDQVLSDGSVGLLPAWQRRQSGPAGDG